MLERLGNTDAIGLIFMLIAAFMVYGARFIVTKIFKIPMEDSLKPIIFMKLTGILIAIIGTLRIFKVI